MCYKNKKKNNLPWWWRENNLTGPPQTRTEQSRHCARQNILLKSNYIFLSSLMLTLISTVRIMTIVSECAPVCALCGCRCACCASLFHIIKKKVGLLSSSSFFEWINYYYCIVATAAAAHIPLVFGPNKHDIRTKILEYKIGCRLNENEIYKNKFTNEKKNIKSNENGFQLCAHRFVVRRRYTIDFAYIV